MLESYFGDETRYLEEMRITITHGPQVAADDYEELRTLCLRLESFAQVADSFGRLHEIDNPHTIDEVVARLDGPMLSRWHRLWTGPRRKLPRRLRDLIEFLQSEMVMARNRIQGSLLYGVASRREQM